MLSLDHFHREFQKLSHNPRDQKFLIAVSGGADSMVLLYLFHHSGFEFEAAHINYKLRGKDSDSDQQLVENFCTENNIKLHLYKVSEEEKPQNSIQIWARKLRYDFFREIQKKEKLDVLATAHHLNDQLETFIINLSKASGIRGLSGIPKNENGIIRPLLNFSKEEIYAFAKENNILFREDLSNQKTDYLRNKIRHKIVPELMEINENFLQNFSKSIDFLNQTKNFLNTAIEEKIEKLKIASFTGQIIINKQKFSQEPEIVWYEILKRFGFTNENEMQKVLTANTGSLFFNHDYQLIINRNEMIFQLASEKDNNENEEILLEIIENKIIIPENIKNEIQNSGSFCWKIDKNKITLPLKLRNKKEGDSFFPIGMMGKKKISKFFKDEKLSILAKQKTWLLCDRNNEILGIIPLRQDRRFAAEKHTEKTLTISLKK